MDIVERINQLEAENQLLKRKMNLLAVGFIATLSMFGLAGATAFDNELDLKIRSLELKDDRGTVRYRLGTSGNEVLGTFYDASGAKRLIHGVADDKRTINRLFDEKQKARVSMSVFTRDTTNMDNLSGISIYDINEDLAVNLGVTNEKDDEYDRNAYVEITDPMNETKRGIRLSLRTGPSKYKARGVLTDREGKERVLNQVDMETADIWLQDQREWLRTGMVNFNAGASYIGNFDKEGKKSFVFGVNNENEALNYSRTTRVNRESW